MRIIKFVMPALLVALVLSVYIIYTFPTKVRSILLNNITILSAYYTEGSLEEKQSNPITDKSKIDEFLDILDDYTYRRKLSFFSTVSTYPVDKVSHIMLIAHSEEDAVTIQLLSNGELLIGNNLYGVDSPFDNSKAKELYGRIKQLVARLSAPS